MDDNYFRFPRPASAPQPDPRPVQWRLSYATVSHNGTEPLLSQELQDSIRRAVRDGYIAMERAIFGAATENNPGITRESLIELLKNLEDNYPALDPISRVHTHPENTWLAQNMLRQLGVDDRSIHLDFGPPLRPETEPEQPQEPPQATDAVDYDHLTYGKPVDWSVKSLERLQNGVTVAVREWMPRDAMLCVSRSGAYQWVVNIGKESIE